MGSLLRNNQKLSRRRKALSISKRLEAGETIEDLAREYEIKPETALGYMELLKRGIL